MLCVGVRFSHAPFIDSQIFSVNELFHCNLLKGIGLDALKHWKATAKRAPAVAGEANRWSWRISSDQRPRPQADGRDRKRGTRTFGY
jgi:hypothetical protein